MRDRLMGAFPRAQVFIDIHAILPGQDFPLKIAKAIRDTTVFLALIGSDWEGMESGGRRRRIDDERDFVHVEVATALELNAHVLPILIERADPPSPETLPLDVGMISRINARRLRHATFDSDFQIIVEDIRKILKAPKSPASKFPTELVGQWISTGMGDAILQYDFYSNGTYQHVGILRQQVQKGTFEMEVFHEGAATVSGSSITLEAFRATASRRHPDFSTEDYSDQPRRAETVSLTWRLQPRGGERFLVLGEGSAPAVVYRYFERPRSATRARQAPVAPAAPVGAGDTASGAMIDWFPLFSEERSARFNALTGWKLMSSPGETVVYLFDPQGSVHDVDISKIPKDGQFKSFQANGRLLPIEIGWYAGGVHDGILRDGTYGKYEVAAGYIGRWVNA
ncbi:hypothetical protein ABIA70_002298 [Arthrobacter sp. 754]